MSLIRDLAVTLPSLEDRLFITCSTANVAGETFALMTTQASTGNVVQSTDAAVGIAGRIIDRLSGVLKKNRFNVACPATHLYSSRGSTAADRKLTLGVKLQHGDSSGGGDMADYSTASQPADIVYFTSARSTEFANWTTNDIDGGSTGPVRLSSRQSYYDLRAAKRFIRAVHIASKNVSTESTGDEDSRFSGTITFLSAADTPASIDARSFVSTATATSTMTGSLY